MRRFRCAGAFVLLALLAGCDKSPLSRQETLIIGADTIQLAAGIDVEDIAVKTVTGQDFKPTVVNASAGDVLRFNTGDALTHVIAFDTVAMPAGAREQFARRNQLRSPPLVMTGVTWVVSLEDAPVGTYWFFCETHNHRAQLVIK